MAQDCFNPYFPGVTFQRSARWITCIKRGLVSILIFLELPFKEPTMLLKHQHLSVSILIFLELPFKDSCAELCCCPQLCFNPYFPGVTFQRYVEVEIVVESGSFNPYFPGVTFQS